jgi:quinol-cytochrome oxidoreductase complex cytochrome b subunit
VALHGRRALFNSIHLWAVELFFFTMVVHLWGKFWMAAWRGGRARVWVTGAVTFLVAIPTALSGYISQQNFDAQWISIQAKDAMNSVGVGAFFNVTNFGQMYGWHVLILPITVLGLRSLSIIGITFGASNAGNGATSTLSSSFTVKPRREGS